MQYSKNFKESELLSARLAKRHGVVNAPTAPHVKNLIALTINVIQPLRDLYSEPIVIKCGYRDVYLNKKVGGVGTSQHLKGEAADLDCPWPGNLDMARHKLARMSIVCIENKLPVDQLIVEDIDGGGAGWLHVSHKRVGEQRGQFLWMAKGEDGRAKYTEYSPFQLIGKLRKYLINA